jgi:hypothetical protein
VRDRSALQVARAADAHAVDRTCPDSCIGERAACRRRNAPTTAPSPAPYHRSKGGLGRDELDAVVMEHAEEQDQFGMRGG